MRNVDTVIHQLLNYQEIESIFTKLWIINHVSLFILFILIFVNIYAMGIKNKFYKKIIKRFSFILFLLLAVFVIFYNKKIEDETAKNFYDINSQKETIEYIALKENIIQNPLFSQLTQTEQELILSCLKEPKYKIKEIEIDLLLKHMPYVKNEKEIKLYNKKGIYSCVIQKSKSNEDIPD